MTDLSVFVFGAALLLALSLGMAVGVRRPGTLRLPVTWPLERWGFPRTGNRRSPRHQDRFHVWLLDEATERSELCEVSDISVGGMAVRGGESLDLSGGDTVLVEFPLGRSCSRIQTRCALRDSDVKADDVLRLTFLDDSDFFHETVSVAMAMWASRLPTSGTD